MAASDANAPVNDLERHQSALISSHWSNIVAHIAPPGTAWSWSESGIEHRTKYRWKESSLIKRAPDGERWETSEALWHHVIEKAGDDETIGAEARGQEILARTEEGRASESTTAGPEKWTSSTVEQFTLDGESTDADEIDNDVDRLSVNRSKVPEKQPEGLEEAANTEGQTSLGSSNEWGDDADERPPWDPGIPGAKSWSRGESATS